MIDSRYTIDDFERIISQGFVYKIDDTIITTIQKLSDQVGAPEYIKTPQFPKNERVKHNNDTTNMIRQPKVSSEDWEHVRSFKTTKMLKHEGIDFVVSTIRKYLNKLSEKNYDSVSEKIFEELSKIVGEGEPLEEVFVECQKVGDAIFTIASGNTFYSKIYAQLLKDLVVKFTFMQNIINKHLNSFRNIFSTIEYCSSNEDYDKFCEINKINERRRATATFYVNLMKLEVIEKKEILNIITHLQDYQSKAMDDSNNTHVVDELSEVLYIMITESKEVFITTNSEETLKLWKYIVNKVDELSQLKKHDRKGITSKTIFKNMDIMDVLSNKSN